MGSDKKWFEDKQLAFSRLYEDVGRNNVKIYDVTDYESRFPISVHPSPLLEKCSQVVVACSGNASTGNDWMVICPYRIDEDSGQKVFDKDPVLTVFDANSGQQHPSGVAAYHQNFDGRTTDIKGFNYDTVENTVSGLRADLTTGAVDLHAGPAPVLNALAHMYKKYKIYFESE